ncbi:hypothetical protein [Kitasatospora cystarginea]|uniref:hypothetical protein n=1 Tax=Kitasatospora cystarginea TaxID=58350 RepID=UPI0031D3FB1A
MSRGRHRQSSVLGRAAPPIAAGALVLAALVELVVSPDVPLVRSVGVAAVFGAVGMAVLLRQRDRIAKQAAEAAAKRRLVAEERYEEQIAEAEYAAEVAEERATRFGRRLTAEKARLAKAETEIARLLRERAVAVAEQAMKEAEAAQRALVEARPEYPATPAAYVRAAAVLRQLEWKAERAAAAREGAGRAQLELRPKAQAVPASATGAARLVPVAPTAPALLVAPAAAAAAQDGAAGSIVPAGPGGGLVRRLAPVAASAEPARPAATAVPVSAASDLPAGAERMAAPAAPAASAAPVAPAVPQPALSAVGPLPARPALSVPRPESDGGTAERAAVQPRMLGAAGAPAQGGAAPAGRQRPRPQGVGRSSGFSFFGRPGAARPATPVPAADGVAELGERADLADVVGDEAVAESVRYAVPGAAGTAAEPAVPPAAQPVQADARPDHARPEVVDLTPHDETELLEVSELRAKHNRQR